MGANDMNQLIEDRKEDLLIQQREQAQDLLQYITGTPNPDQTNIQNQAGRIKQLGAQIYELKRLERKMKIVERQNQRKER